MGWEQGQKPTTLNKTDAEAWSQVHIEEPEGGESEGPPVLRGHTCGFMICAPVTLCPAAAPCEFVTVYLRLGGSCTCSLEGAHLGPFTHPPEDLSRCTRGFVEVHCGQNISLHCNSGGCR